MESSWQKNCAYWIRWYSAEDTNGNYYYGNYGGYDIMLDPTNLDAETTLVIGSEVFLCNTSFALYAYRDGQWDLLKEVYDQGLVSSEDIYAIAQYHRKWMEKLWPNRNYMTQYLRQDIENAWLAKTGQTLGEWYDDKHGANPHGVRYYATYNGYDILFVNIEAEPAAHIVDGIEFKHETGFALYAYRHGEFHSLADAYDQGFLNEMHIVYLLAIHQWHEQELCGVEAAAE